MAEGMPNLRLYYWDKYGPSATGARKHVTFVHAEHAVTDKFPTSEELVKMIVKEWSLIRQGRGNGVVTGPPDDHHGLHEL